MPSSGTLRHVALVRANVSGEHIASVIRVKRIGKLETMLEVTSNQRMLQRNTQLLVTANTVIVTTVNTSKTEECCIEILSC
jgi:hypothetical protein